MKTSVIRQRVADFLKRYQPFDSLPADDLLNLAGSGRVKFHESEEYIFRQGQPKGPAVWFVQQGRVELVEEYSGREELRDVLGEGDVLGLDWFGSNGLYPHSARTTTDVILYSIDAGMLATASAQYPAVKRFLAAHFSVTGSSCIGRTSWLDAEAPSPEFLRARLATIMSKTEAALQPLLPAIAAGVNTRQAIREMVRSRSEALAITEDGKAASPLEAILTASDLALFCDRNPAHLLREILAAGSVEVLAPLLRLGTRLILDGLARPADIDDCSHIGTEIVAALTEACIRLAHEEVVSAKIEPPAMPFCWMALGSLARGELLRPELPTVEVVYDDTHEACTADTGAYFAAVAGQTTAWLHACGLDAAGAIWPEGSHPCMPLSEWKRFYRETICNPIGVDLVARREFFDIRSLAGHDALPAELQRYIFSELRKLDMLIPLLANDTLSHLPPLTFYRGLVLDLDGGERKSLNLAETALNPISDAARVFSLRSCRTSCTNTLHRLNAAAADFPESDDVFRDAAEAFRIAQYHRALAGTSVIDPSQIDRYDQRLLKTAFTSILRLLELTTSALTSAA